MDILTGVWVSVGGTLTPNAAFSAYSYPNRRFYSCHSFVIDMLPYHKPRLASASCAVFLWLLFILVS